MRILSFHTKEYKEHFEDIEDFHYVNLLDNYYSFSIRYENFNIDSIVTVIKNILLDNNPITKNSKKIRGIVLNNFNGFDEKVREDILSFFDGETQMNIDGYITFRLSGYEYKVNYILYKLIKNCLI